MRKVGFLFLCVMSFMGSIMAQKSNVGDAKWSFGGGLLAADLFSPKPGIDYGFKNPLQFGPRVSVWKNFNSSVSFSVCWIKKYRKIRSLSFFGIIENKEVE